MEIREDLIVSLSMGCGLNGGLVDELFWAIGTDAKRPMMQLANGLRAKAMMRMEWDREAKI
ncbi:hypothetical protein SAMN02745166_01150 [Prosthecobacter debontii]|uniref:Uncharacterized protein n=1 Tax=Prosthecobacter debontii TaxID=48467 RepID=A0A1T4X738_9BACT|nr:hypothetical protein SAMN02745166_01150 [Prosthecobacter debontii]